MSGFETPPAVETRNSGIKKDSARDRKQRVWDAARKEIDTWADALGEDVDERVKEAVTACKVLGLNTGQSCQGHTDHGIGAPWIRFEAPNEPKYRYVGEQDMWIRIAKKYRLSSEKARRGYNMQAWQEGVRQISDNKETLQYGRWKKETGALRDRVASLLAEFYTGREPDTDIRLDIMDMGGSFVIGNGGEDALPAEERNLGEEEKRALGTRLARYQSEMVAFGEFLRQKFFERH